ncbi:Aspartate carbamoyltransferase regulatory chain [Methanimicrococcus sp. At1]|uniref:Aspartate carbamoyltransferase regulatory chain n=1 Tax=Methanimicrococcus hacksteinii TaxID=3028293 RepID=A0ABU3VPQ0_9EURY|nr:aspartate carbamoyltransferase regulatory subunit [Methanimicrococcus sp. At1]MDV0445131.1 Aspartate carbamoyltransferase regulatory chain [Methanimicrococcus sp. At1]
MSPETDKRRSKKLGDKNDLRIKAIENGTVIDHIIPGQALNVLNILSDGENFTNTVSVVMNAGGSRGDKDVVKIEGRELTEKEVDAISLLSPKATVSIIRDYEVVQKRHIKTPDSVCGIVKCINPNCITNSGEPIETRFAVTENEKGLALRCIFCESVMTEDLIHFIE